MTVSVTLRATKGAALTHAELDANFTNLKNVVDTLAPSGSVVPIAAGGTGLSVCVGAFAAIRGNSSGTAYEGATIEGTANQVSVSTATPNQWVLSTPQSIHTGASPTFAGLTLGSGTGVAKLTSGVVGSITDGTANQVLGMNNAADGYEYKTITATANRVSVTHAAGSITLSTPQDIHTGASPTFAGATIGTLTGLIKGATGVLSAATAGTDYVAGGTGAANQVAYFSGTGAITGGSGLTWNGSTLSIAGAAALTGTVTQTAGAALNINKKLVLNSSAAVSTQGLNCVRAIQCTTGTAITGWEHGMQFNILRNYDGAADDDGGTVANIWGIETSVGHLALNAAATPVTTDVRGVSANLYLSSGTITTLYGLNVSVSGSAASVGTFYGLKIGNAPTTTVAGYSIYTGTGAISFGGAVTIRDTTASTSTTTGSLINAGGFGNAGDAWFGGDVTVTNNKSLKVTNTQNAIMSLDSQAGYRSVLTARRSNYDRWSLYMADSDAESGGNAGSRFALRAFDDAGATIDYPLVITRAAGGAITLARPTSITNSTSSTSTTTGALIVSGGAGVAGRVNSDSLAVSKYAAIGGGVSTSTGLSIAGSTLSGAAQNGVYITSSASTEATSYLSGIQTYLSTTAGSYTINNVYGFVASGISSIGADSAVNTYTAFSALNNTNAGSNISFKSAQAAGANNYAFYSSGTAKSSFGGVVTCADTTASTSTTTGSLINAGGFGCAGAGWFGGNVYTSNTDSNTTIGSNTTALMRIRNSYNAGYGAGSELQFEGPVSGGSTILGCIRVAYNEWASGGLGGDMIFGTRAAGADPVQTRMTILRGGNVGIGTAAPAQMLAVGSSTPMTVTSAGVVSVANTTASTSTTSGSLINAGGFGNAGAFYCGGAAVVTGDVICQSGQMIVGTSAAGETTLIMNAAATNQRTLAFRTANVNRWFFGATADAESGSDAGSNFVVSARTDAGVGIDAPFSIVRAAGGAITLGRPTVVKGSTASDLPTYGSEFLSESAGWTTTGWTGTDRTTGWTHTAGNTTALSESTAAVATTKYQIAYTITGRTAGSVTIAFGGQSIASVSATGAFGPTATSTAGLTITPTTDFDGKIVISIKAITAASSATQTWQDSGGTVRVEARATSASNNTYVGLEAGCYTTTGFYNTALGVRSLRYNTTGYYNTAIGRGALTENTTGYYNTAVGLYGLSGVTTGYANTVVGSDCGAAITTGGNNTLLGTATGGGITTGSGNTVLGAGITGLSASLTNNIILASGATNRMSFDGTDWSVVSTTEATTHTAASMKLAGGLAVAKRIVSPKMFITEEGGFAVRLIAGEALNRGEIVYIPQSGTGNDGEVRKAPTSGEMPVGVVFQNANAAAEVVVITSGIAYVLPETGKTAARGNVLFVSASEAGHADFSSTTPVSEHWREVGHFLDTGSGNGAITRAIVHFN